MPATKKRSKQSASRSTPAKAMPKSLPGTKEIAEALEKEFADAGIPVLFPWSTGADLAMVSVDTLRRAVRDGELFATPVTARRTLLTRRGMAIWMANRAVKDTPGVAACRRRMAKVQREASK